MTEATTPTPDECRQALADLRRRADDLAREATDLDAELVRWITAARAAGLTAAAIAEASGMSRAWLYRKYGEAMAADETETTTTDRKGTDR